MTTTAERTEVEVWRGTALDLVRIAGSGQSPTGRVAFVQLDHDSAPVRVRWRPPPRGNGRPGFTCDTHGRPFPACRHIASAAAAFDHLTKENQ